MACKKTFLILLLIQILFQYTSVNGQPKAKFFRKDYTYIDDTQNFYKIHTIHRTWQDAKKRCAMEGASLFYPADLAEANIVIEYWNRTQSYHWIYIGVSSLLAKGVFETIEGIPISDVYNNWGQGEPNDANGIEDCVILRRDGTLNDNRCDIKYPFICKKTLASLEWNSLCDMPDLSYVYNAELGKCYKFHLTPMNWTDAYAICSAEQSYLAVINSKEEDNFLVNMTATAPKEHIRGNYLSGAVFLGFHNRDGDGWKTIKGTSLADSGYAVWGNLQPDGGDRETCGSMFYNGHLNDLSCSHRCFFICEHEIGILSVLIDEKFGAF